VAQKSKLLSQYNSLLFLSHPVYVRQIAIITVGRWQIVPHYGSQNAKLHCAIDVLAAGHGRDFYCEMT